MFAMKNPEKKSQRGDEMREKRTWGTRFERNKRKKGIILDGRQKGDRQKYAR